MNCQSPHMGLIDNGLLHRYARTDVIGPIHLVLHGNALHRAQVDIPSERLGIRVEQVDAGVVAVSCPGIEGAVHPVHEIGALGQVVHHNGPHIAGAVVTRLELIFPNRLLRLHLLKQRQPDTCRVPAEYAEARASVVNDGAHGIRASRRDSQFGWIDLGHMHTLGLET